MRGLSDLFSLAVEADAGRFADAGISLHAAAVEGPKAVFDLAAATMLTLECGFLTPYPCACLGIALVSAIGARWWTEALDQKRALCP